MKHQRDSNGVYVQRCAMHAGLQAASRCSGLTLITAGNYGGKLGPHHFHLRELL